jgi:hypothetical protein
MDDIFFNPATFELRRLAERNGKLIGKTSDGNESEVPLGTLLFQQSEEETSIDGHETMNMTEVRTNRRIVETCKECKSATMTMGRIGKHNFRVVKRCRCGYMIVI